MGLMAGLHEGALSSLLLPWPPAHRQPARLPVRPWKVPPPSPAPAQPRQRPARLPVVYTSGRQQRNVARFSARGCMLPPPLLPLRRRRLAQPWPPSEALPGVERAQREHGAIQLLAEGHLAAQAGAAGGGEEVGAWVSRPGGRGWHPGSRQGVRPLPGVWGGGGRRALQRCARRISGPSGLPPMWPRHATHVPPPILRSTPIDICVCRLRQQPACAACPAPPAAPPLPQGVRCRLSYPPHWVRCRLSYPPHWATTRSPARHEAGGQPRAAQPSRPTPWCAALTACPGCRGRPLLPGSERRRRCVGGRRPAAPGAA